MPTPTDEDLDEDYNVTHTGEDDHIEDPVRIYLMQMGGFRFLNRHEELQERWRPSGSSETGGSSRHSMLATDYVLHAAIAMLEQIRDGKLRLDRTIEVSVINVREKKRLLRMIRTESPHMLKHLVSQDQRDFAVAGRKHATPQAASRESGMAAAGRAAEQGRASHRRTGPAAQRLQPMLDRLQEISQRMDVVQRQLATLHAGPEASELRRELCHLMRITLESPATLRRGLARTDALQQEYRAAKRARRPAICGSSCRSPSVTATAV